jgi:hypothetical protein
MSVTADFRKSQKNKDISILYRDFLGFIMFEGVENVINAPKAKKNLHYIRFVPQREQHMVL